jgi:hypothetical protein
MSRDLLIDGGTWSDEVFTHDHIGTFNITRLRAHVQAFPEFFPWIPMEVTPELQAAVMRNTPDPIVALRIPRDRLSEPILILDHEAGAVVIDGNHRALRLFEVESTMILAIFVPMAAAEQHMVRFQWAYPDGHREEIGPTEILAHTA